MNQEMIAFTIISLANTGWPTGVGPFKKKKYSVGFQLEMDLFLQN